MAADRDAADVAAPDPPAWPQTGPSGIGDAVDLLAGHRIALLTGAGLSTDSGIPDYRGPDAPARRPMTLQQFLSGPEMRRRYWARNHLGWHRVHTAEPNAGHHAAARLQRRGLLSGLITQNVDLLHERAGSRRVVDLHGAYDRVICLSCGTVSDRGDLDRRLTRLNPGFVEHVESLGEVRANPDADVEFDATGSFHFAACAVCGGILKPDVVFFGETVPAGRVGEAYAIVDEASALLVAGSSLAVMSGLRFVHHAHKAGKPVVIVNRGPTRGDGRAAVVVEAGVSESLSVLADELPALDEPGPGSRARR